MRHKGVTEEVFEMAALYSLGAMSESEAQAYEKHLAKCDVCRKEQSSFEAVASNLAYAVESEAPPQELKSRLLDQIAHNITSESRRKATPITLSPFLSVRSNEGEWREMRDGVMMKLLNFDKELGLATSLVRMSPGTYLPEHRHEGVEQFYILEGDCNINGEILGPGDYHRAESGSVHNSTSTQNGTMFLLVAPLKYDFGISP